MGLSAVIIGAMGAHSLKPHLDSDQLSWISKGVFYQFVHTIMVFISIILFYLFKQKHYLHAGWAFVIGSLLFSGSLYLLATRGLIGLTSWKWLGPITPLGGLTMIMGWLLVLLGTIKLKTDQL